MQLGKLIKKLAHGDKTAFDAIYAETHSAVYYVALSVVRNRMLAEDVMQNVYLKIIRYADGFKADSNAKSWILTIAKNEALNLKKSRSRTEFVDAEENLALFGTENSDDYGLLIDTARHILSDEEFRILMLITACGYKRREIAKILNIPLSTVTWKYREALEKLRKHLKDEI